jgi:hypothetical protein
MGYGLCVMRIPLPVPNQTKPNKPNSGAPYGVRFALRRGRWIESAGVAL